MILNEVCMKRLTMTMLAMAMAATLTAQVDEDWSKTVKNSNQNAYDEYEKFKQQSIDNYQDFRRKANADYAKFLEETWKLFNMSPPEEIPWQPKPEDPRLIFEGPNPSPDPTLEPDLEPNLDPESTPEPMPEPGSEPELTPEPDLEPEPTPEPDPEPEPTPEPNPVPEPTPELKSVPDPIAVPKFDPKPEPRTEPRPTHAPRIPSREIELEGIKSTPKFLKQPEPLAPIRPKPMPAATVQTVYLYGSSFMFHFQKGRTLKLADNSEKSVANMWRKLSDEYYDNIVGECLQQRTERSLCDWAYIQLTETVAQEYCGGKNNEAIVMQAYLLTQSGYQIRFGRLDTKLVLLIGSTEEIFGYGYFEQAGSKFYVFDTLVSNKNMHVSKQAFPNERPFTLALTQPKLPINRTEKRTIESRHYPDVKVTVELNANLIDFYDSYPRSSMWSYYAKASLSDQLKEQLYPMLRKAIEGKREYDAVNIILDFIQTGFNYETDQRQFGYERPLFPDETFYYPSCDCEDRAVLFACIVRDLLQLDVVLLHYPAHLSTAVHFNEDLGGTFIDVDGKNYLVCEPTYLTGAPAGRCGYAFRDKKPIVVKIDELYAK